MKARLGAAGVAVLIGTAMVTPLSAQSEAPPSFYDRQDTSQPPANRLPQLLTEVGLDQKLGARVPLDLAFVDEDGRTVTLGDYFGSRPVILTLNYYECPMLCTEVLNGLASSIGVLNFTAGREFEIVTVSINPRDTPALARAKKANYLERYKRPGAERGWHFLTGTQQSIETLAAKVGFRYAYNQSVDQYAHPSGIMVLTSDGRLSRYFFGIEYAPRDVRLALIDASDRKIGSWIDQAQLFCFHYDPKSAKYSLAVMRLVRAAGAATVLAIVGGVVLLRRRERAGGRRGQ